MKIQLYPTYPKADSDLSPVLELDPITKMIDEFFKKDVDNEKNICYNNYIK